jgi:hypothetical protein
MVSSRNLEGSGASTSWGTRGRVFACLSSYNIPWFDTLTPQRRWGTAHDP